LGGRGRVVEIGHAVSEGDGGDLQEVVSSRGSTRGVVLGECRSR
jgi:hypothetical protein